MKFYLQLLLKECWAFKLNFLGQAVFCIFFTFYVVKKKALARGNVLE